MKLELVKNYSTFSLASMALGGSRDGKESTGAINPAFSESAGNLNRNRRGSVDEELENEVGGIVSVRNSLAECCTWKTVDPLLSMFLEWSFHLFQYQGFGFPD